jgi:hypothetical protein
MTNVDGPPPPKLVAAIRRTTLGSARPPTDDGLGPRDTRSVDREKGGHQVFQIDRITVARRHQEMLRDAANERLSMSAAPRPRTHVRWLDRLVGPQPLPAA